MGHHTWKRKYLLVKKKMKNFKVSFRKEIKNKSWGDSFMCLRDTNKRLLPQHSGVDPRPARQETALLKGQQGQQGVR